MDHLKSFLSFKTREFCLFYVNCKIWQTQQSHFPAILLLFLHLIKFLLVCWIWRKRDAITTSDFSLKLHGLYHYYSLQEPYKKGASPPTLNENLGGIFFQTLWPNLKCLRRWVHIKIEKQPWTWIKVFFQWKWIK